MQDCSFHAQLHFPAELVTGPLWIPAKDLGPMYADGPPAPIFYGMRFSNFGQMVELYDEALIVPDLLQSVRPLILKHEYVWIPTKVLALPYDGKFGKFIPTWFVRYFDYI
jgi:hypothetical protein